MKSLFKTGKHVLIAALASGGPGVHYSQVQIQKILFILTKQFPNEIGEDLFNFEPYSYGPFDQTIPNMLDELIEADFVAVTFGHRYELYVMKNKGFERSIEVLKNVPENVAAYMRGLAEWAVGCSFSELVSAVYNSFPESRPKSVYFSND